MWVLYFLLITNHQDVVSEKCVIHTQHGCGRDASFFLWKHEKKKQNKEKNDKLVVFNQVTNYVGSNPSIPVRDFLCPCVGTFRFLGLTLGWDNLGISQHCNLLIKKKNCLDHSNICATRQTFITYPLISWAQGRRRKQSTRFKTHLSFRVEPELSGDILLNRRRSLFLLCFSPCMIDAWRSSELNSFVPVLESFPFSNLKLFNSKADYTQWP